MVNLTIEELVRKANQAWEMAGLARQDRDFINEKQWTKKARELDSKIKLQLRKDYSVHLDQP